MECHISIPLKDHQLSQVQIIAAIKVPGREPRGLHPDPAGLHLARDYQGRGARQQLVVFSKGRDHLALTVLSRAREQPELQRKTIGNGAVL